MQLYKDILAIVLSLYMGLGKHKALDATVLPSHAPKAMLCKQLILKNKIAITTKNLFHVSSLLCDQSF